MMKYRKLFALISICTLLTFLAPLAAKANDLDGHWAREAIEELAEEGIILPYPDGSFGPNDVVTRGDFAAMVAKTFDYGPSSRSSFADVEGHPAANYISGLVQAEVLPTGELFRPDDPITRGEAADMVIAALGLREASGHLPESPPPSRMWSRNIPTGEPSNWPISLGCCPRPSLTASIPKAT
jgi:hypothetical protein